MGDLDLRQPGSPVHHEKPIQKGLSFDPTQYSIKDVMEMDPLTLAAIAAPFVVKGAEAFSNAAGEKLGAKVGELCQAVINKFKGDSDAEETLALPQKKPDSKGRQIALEEVLAEKLEADPDFADELQKLVDEVQKGAAPGRPLTSAGKRCTAPRPTSPAM